MRSRSSKSKLRWLFAGVLAPLVFIGLAGCGTTLTKFETDAPLPSDLPPDLQDRFQVKDEVTLGVATPRLQDLAKAEPRSKKRGKKGKKGQKDQDAKTEAPKPNAFDGKYPMRRPEKDPTWVGETMDYDITWLGVSAARFRLEVLPHKVVNGRKVYHVRGTAKSTGVFSLVYRIHDYGESYIDYDGIYSHRLHVNQDESRQNRDMLELYDSEKGQSFFWSRWSRPNIPFEEKKEFFGMPPFPQDSMSALFFMRTQPLPDGGVIKFPVISEGQTWDGSLTVVRREELKAPWGEKVKVVVIKPEAQFQGQARRGGDSYIFVTDDERRVPIRVEIKAKIGAITAHLTEWNKGQAPQ